MPTIRASCIFTKVWCSLERSRDVIWYEQTIIISSRSSNSCLRRISDQKKIIFTSSEENEDQISSECQKYHFILTRIVTTHAKDKSSIIIADSIILHWNTALQIQSDSSGKCENEWINFGQCALTQCYITIFEVHGRTFWLYQLFYYLCIVRIILPHLIWFSLKNLFESSRNGGIYSLYIRTCPICSNHFKYLCTLLWHEKFFCFINTNTHNCVMREINKYLQKHANAQNKNWLMMIAKIFPFLLYFSMPFKFVTQHFKRQNQKLEMPHISWKVHKIDRIKSYESKAKIWNEMACVAWSKQKYANESMYWSNVSRIDWSRLSLPLEFFSVFIV